MGRIVLYGAGKRGQAIYNFLLSKGLGKYIYGFCDEAAREIGMVKDQIVYLPEELENQNVIFCLTLLDGKKREEIRNNLSNKTCIDFSDLSTVLNIDRVKFNREFCAFYHIDEMDNYFKNAENELDIFWGEQSTFYKMFKKLELTNVIELGCGRGRHVTKYISSAKKITLVDILQKNIDFCKRRFEMYDNIFYYKNEGYDLSELETNGYTALFTYDAMVHFEMMDIYSYLLDIYRVLKKGGRALFHHSNYSYDYHADFSNAPHSRNFMSKDIFAYLAYRAGFKVIEQCVIDWSDTPQLDCLTLVEKE